MREAGKWFRCERGETVGVKRFLRGCVLVLLIPLVYLLLLAFTVYRTRSQQASPSPYNEGGNGLWMAHRWFDDSTRKPLQVDEIEALGRRCQLLGIDYFFVHVGPVDSHGNLPPANLKRFIATRAEMARWAPGAVWLAWVGAPNAAFEGKADDTFGLDDEKARQTLLGDLDRLYEAGFKGVSYDFEPLANEDDNFLELLKETRSRFPDKLISVAGPHPQPPGIVSFTSRFWSLDYYEKVARLSDQVALMGYDTMQPSEDMYSRVLAYEVGSLSPHIGCLFMVGLPSYDDNFPYHTKAETLPAGLRGAIAGGARHIAIYADWTTDEAEWGEVGRIWGNVNRKRGAAPARVAQSRGHSADVIDDVVP